MFALQNYQVYCSQLYIIRGPTLPQQASTLSLEKFSTVAKMRTLIVVAVILQLFIRIIQIHGEYEFGDIISFKRTCSCKPFTYKHFAIYVGNTTMEGKMDGQDIFHRTGDRNQVPDCMFGTLTEQGTGNRENYLDEEFSDELKQLSDVIPNRIKAMITACGVYNVLNNNCEHLATYVRYGHRISRQPGTFAQIFCKKRPRDCSELDALVKEMEENEQNRQKCIAECSSSGPNNG
ncbi:uncharacterized protein [Channa argus]|uniref:uncharacterized protein n=1 Tax=Channa argus TaxID=215402 RepID=UPI003521F4C8